MTEVVAEHPASDAAPRVDVALVRQARHALRAVTRPAAYLGAARELALSAFHVATYPLGVRSRPLRAVEDEVGATDHETARMPVILLHGYVHNHSAFLLMSRALKKAGFRHIDGFNYNPLRRDLSACATALAAEVERVLQLTGAPRCMIVGHSMGGIIARLYVQELGGHERVDTVITLATPHRGTFTSYLGLGPACGQLRPGTPFLRRLEEGARPSTVRWIAYYSDLDLLVTPAVSAKLVHPALHATNIRVRDTGHLSLLLSSDVIRSVVDHLSDPSLHRTRATPRRGHLQLVS